jgi:hypothetical protein
MLYFNFLYYWQWRNQPENIGTIFFPTDLKTLVGNFSLVLKSNGIQIFLINDNNEIIRKFELSMT